MPGAGRLVNQMVQSVTNPKDQKQKEREQRKQKQQEQQQREEEQQSEQQQEQLEQAAAVAAADAEAAAGELLEGAADAAAAAVPEAVAAAATSQQLQQQQVSEWTEEEVAPKTVQQRYNDTVHFLTNTGTGKGISIAAGLFLGATFVIALYRTYQKYSSPRAQRKRMIDKNKLLVEELSAYLPDRRSELSAGVVRKLRGATGFSAVEVFRKYLWFLLRERKFDAAAVQDMVLLKGVLGLSDEQVAEALQERAARIYDKYGTLMLNVDGFTAEGVERKATCRALFSKLLYLTEHEPLVAQGSEAFKTTDLRMIFGATDEDVEKLRIVSLYDMDIEAMESLMKGSSAADSAAQGEQGSQPSGQPDKPSS
uniref:Armadillo-like repeats domain-containing protein n=1 Tax=Tetradesmus obliquus TaxID=3088 RepID=A0A383V399_TETOB|eukprot:jgi/Sobl393_1/280/SZX60068.1